MMSDLLERLRYIAASQCTSAKASVYEHTCWQAADEIEHLTDECAQLRQGYTAIRDDMAVLVKKIKQLNDEGIHNEGVMVALREGYLERGGQD
jgi:hypothetical protein